MGHLTSFSLTPTRSCFTSSTSSRVVLVTELADSGLVWRVVCGSRAHQNVQTGLKMPGGRLPFSASASECGKCLEECKEPRSQRAGPRAKVFKEQGS